MGDFCCLRGVPPCDRIKVHSYYSPRWCGPKAPWQGHKKASWWPVTPVASYRWPGTQGTFLKSVRVPGMVLFAACGKCLLATAKRCTAGGTFFYDFPWFSVPPLGLCRVLPWFSVPATGSATNIAFFSVLSRVFNDRFCEGQYLPITWKSPIKSKNSTDTVSQFLEFYRDVLCVKIEKKKLFSELLGNPL